MELQEDGTLDRPEEYDWEYLETKGIFDMDDLEAYWEEETLNPDPDAARDAERDGWFD